MGSRWAPKAGKLSTWPLRPRRASQSLQTSPLPTCISRNPPGDHSPDGLGTGTPTLHLSILQVPPTAPSSAQPERRSAVCGFSEDGLSSQNPCVPQRASSPSAGTSWIWYSEVWSIWTQTWCDLQGGKGDITSKTEQVLSVSLPLPLLQPQPMLWVNAKRGNTLTWHYSCAQPRVLHQNRLTSLFCCYR